MATLPGRPSGTDLWTTGEAELRPFRIAVSDSELAGLRQRLDRIRWAPEPRGGDQGYGVSRATVERVVWHGAGGPTGGRGRAG